MGPSSYSVMVMPLARQRFCSSAPMRRSETTMSGCSSPTPAQKLRNPLLAPSATRRGWVSGVLLKRLAAVPTAPRMDGLPTIQIPRSSGGGFGTVGGGRVAVCCGDGKPGNWHPASAAATATMARPFDRDGTLLSPP
ncbi:protein of unknown function (plasmid) [Azospirillum baldaniorum]|uniref:Uncharacterized protein n=1 Tax=Azospirillum baldaniorum TaxID=1064539 RepID=A0A9P1JY16_9PROT|nr:protein of unknown function [Azospirillum baldaniorum]